MPLQRAACRSLYNMAIAAGGRCLDEISPHDPNIVQRYMHRPHLLNGFKYDLRIYVLLSSIAPLRVFLYREGLVRVCTQLVMLYQLYVAVPRVGPPTLPTARTFAFFF